MLVKKSSLVISFNKTIDAMSVEEYCLKHGVEGRLIPLPKEISAGCGLAWKCSIDNKSTMQKVLNDMNIAYDKMCEIEI